MVMASARECVVYVTVALVCHMSLAEDCASALSCSSNTNMHDLQDTVGYLQSHLRQISGGLEPCTLPRDCSDVRRIGERQDGHYQIQPEGSCHPFHVYCEFEEDGSAWTLLQRRVNNYTDFNRTWDEYRNGFGIAGPSFNFWLGLENMHHLTMQRQYTIRFDISDLGDSRSANYSLFYINSESDGYSLMYDGYMGGPLADGLRATHRGMKFSTIDRDNDLHSTNCAQTYGGWWHNACFGGGVNLNGHWPTSGHTNTYSGIQWLAWKNKYAFQGSAMKIAPTV